MIAAIVTSCALLGGIALWILTGLWWLLPLGFVLLFLLGGGIAFAYLYFVCKGVDMSSVPEHDDPLFRRLLDHYADAIVFALGMHVKTRGLEKAPESGRYLLVCNHINDLDPIVLVSRFHKGQLAFIGKQEVRDMTIVGPLLLKTMGQFINRENDREALKTILRCIQLLKDDEVSVAVFPEGYTSMNGHLKKFRSGSLKIALKAKVPIVVCTLQGTNHAFHNAKRLRPTEVQLHLLDVITPEQQAGRTAVDVGEQIYQMMAADLGPDYAPLESENP